MVFSCNDPFYSFFFFEYSPRWPSYFQMDWMMILKSLNKNLMNLEKKVPLMGRAGKGVLANFVISKPSPGSYICRLPDSTEFAASPLWTHLGGQASSHDISASTFFLLPIWNSTESSVLSFLSYYFISSSLAFLEYVPASLAPSYLTFLCLKCQQKWAMYTSAWLRNGRVGQFSSNTLKVFRVPSIGGQVYSCLGTS